MADNLSKDAQNFIDTCKRAYRTQLEMSDYSDEEIQNLMYDAVQKGLMANSTTKEYEYIGKKQACEAILEERKADRTNSEKAEEEWPEIMHQLQNEAVLNLKTAISPNAQLIAAVLEEEGDLTEDELAGWCDELASLPEDEFKRLLNGMQAEKVISRNEGKYHLLNICTPSLFPEDIKKYMQEKLPEVTGDEELKAIQFKVLDMLRTFGAKTAYSIPSEMEWYAKINPDDVLNEENVKGHPFISAKRHIPGSAIRRMMVNGVLCKYRTSYSPVYYFPMLGHKEDE